MYKKIIKGVCIFLISIFLTTCVSCTKNKEVEIEGYVFVGWYKTDKEKFTTGIINENITLTGKYIKEGTTYNISYIFFGGSP